LLKAINYRFRCARPGTRCQKVFLELLPPQPPDNSCLWTPQSMPHFTRLKENPLLEKGAPSLERRSNQEGQSTFRTPPPLDGIFRDQERFGRKEGSPTSGERQGEKLTRDDFAGDFLRNRGILPPPFRKIRKAYSLPFPPISCSPPLSVCLPEQVLPPVRPRDRAFPPPATIAAVHPSHALFDEQAFPPSPLSPASFPGRHYCAASRRGLLILSAKRPVNPFF